VGVKSLIDIARRLRKNSTETERYLWRYLRNGQVGGVKFRRQQQLGKYIVDFVNFENKVVIEVDGGQHADNSSDKIRDEWLRSALLTPHPNPLPQGERENNF
jgi:very-short-patch-repair endonuclease